MANDTSQEDQADFVTIIPNDLISEVMEGYFNKVMFKQKVKVVDLRATDAGYMFSLSFERETLPPRVEATKEALDILRTGLRQDTYTGGSGIPIYTQHHDTITDKPTKNATAKVKG